MELKLQSGDTSESVSLQYLQRFYPRGWYKVMEEGFQKMLDAGCDGVILSVGEVNGELYLQFVEQPNEEVLEVVNQLRFDVKSVCIISGEPSKQTVKETGRSYSQSEFDRIMGVVSEEPAEEPAE